MKNIFKLFLIIFIFFVSGHAIENKKEQNEDYETYVNQIIKSFANEMEREFGLVCCGHGGSMPYDVEEISIKFAAYQRATIEEARALEVKVTERFIQAINSHEKIRPFLREFPFKANRAEVAISFKKPDNTLYTDGSVAYVYQVKNKIIYRADKENSPKLIPITEEPYEEALNIVKGSSTVGQAVQKDEEKPANVSQPCMIEITSEDDLKAKIDELKTKFKFYGGESS